MFWTEEETNSAQVPGEVIDLRFAISCRELPVDHAYLLSQAILAQCPWLISEPLAGLHIIHGAGSQNGWERPPHSPDERLLLSRRTHFGLRIPQILEDRVIQALRGVILDIGGCAMTLGDARRHLLTPNSTLFSRFVASPCGEDETVFLQRTAQSLASDGIRLKKALCGKTTPLSVPGGFFFTRSLLLAGLNQEESLRLQWQGLGTHRLMGCGLFIPHKGIESVKKTGTG